jgi:hypothetical protein
LPLTEQFKGSGKAALETYGGQLDVLNTAAGEASETIGYALLDALKSLTGETDIDKLAKDIDTAAGAAALFIKFTAKGIKPSTGLWGYWQGFVESIPGYEQIVKDFAKELDVALFPTGPLGNFQMSTGVVLDQSATQLSKIEQERAKLERERLAKEKALLKLKALAAKKALMDEKARASLAKASSTFDLTKIQIAAALKSTYDKDERLRLLAMQEIENDNGETALKYIEQLALLTAEQQTNKLSGIKTISETELNYINQLLLDELQRIKTTKMSEEEAALARQAAYAKYNAAIQQSGGLAEANFYTEKTQVELLSIAKLASLDKVAAAQATMDILNYTTQKTIIERIAAAQKIADDAKYQALEDYLALLAKPLPTPGLQGGGDAGGGGGGGSQGPRFGIGGQPIWDDGMGGPGYGTGQGMGTGSVDNSVSIVVEGSVLDGEDFSDIINRAMLDNIRRGLSQFPAGTLPG